MANHINATRADGSRVEFIDQVRASGAMKDVYFSPGGDYVVALFRGAPDPALRERLELITGAYRERIFNQPGGEYWKKLFCWPTAVVEYQGRLGVTAPFYEADFFFRHGSRDNDRLGIRGREKEGKWYASPANRNRYLDPRELGNWMLHIKLCLQTARAVRRLHAAGLAHSDLSYKNVLVDPTTGRACLIDIDGLVVPGKLPPDVVGTPDFIAPECVMTSHLAHGDPARKLPSIATDRHALAVLIYLYLLQRHPLRGDQVHDADDPQRDEELAMGAKALFVEHPDDPANRIGAAHLQPFELPWKDTARLPCQVAGPYLSELFMRAFTAGLHDPAQRPSADEWEHALVKTVDLLQPCANSACEQQWFVFDNQTRPCCPFCKTPFSGTLPVLNLYSSRADGAFRPDGHRLMVYANQSLYPWHVNRDVRPNERLRDEDKKRVGYFLYFDHAWYLINETLAGLADARTGAAIPPGGRVRLEDGAQLLMSREPGGRLFVVQMAGG
jgi:hypothetical protein